MPAGDLEILDLLVADASEDDEPRVKVGDVASGAGVGQDCVFAAPCGFGGMPNPPDGNGSAGQAVCWTPSNDRIVIACADNRYNGKAGTLALGDSWCTSNCDAAFKLTQAANKIQLLALAQNMEITLDAQNQAIKLSLNGAQVYLDATTVQLVLGPLKLILTGNTVSIATVSGPPAVLQVQGVPVTVP